MPRRASLASFDGGRGACGGLHVRGEKHGRLLARDHLLELLDRARRVLRLQAGVGHRLRLHDDVLRRDVAPAAIGEP